MTTSEQRPLPVDSIGGINVTLTRTRPLTVKEGTTGVLRIQTGNLLWRCRTLELPWLDNQPQISCIPAGIYTCRHFNSAKFGETFQVCDVPGRSGILFHAGNSVKDTRGCILLGRDCEIFCGRPFLTASRATMEAFRKTLDGIDSFELEIK